MSWGKGITIVMVSFMTFILYMVITLMSKTTDLESENYYEKEMEFDKEITAMSNTNALKEKVKITQNEDYFVLQFPDLENVNSIEVLMFRPNNMKQDRVFTVNNSKTLMIPINQLKKGNYKMNIQYKIKNELYMQKQNVKI